MSMDITIFHVSGITINDLHRTIGGGYAATLEIAQVGGKPIKIDLYGNSMTALCRPEVEYDPEHLDDVQACLRREEG